MAPDPKTTHDGLDEMAARREKARQNRRSRTPPPPRNPKSEVPPAAPAPEPTPQNEEEEDNRSAFTWRLTADQKLDHETLILVLKRDLKRGRLDKAVVLDALMTLAAENRSVYSALLSRLRST